MSAETIRLDAVEEEVSSLSDFVESMDRGQIVIMKNLGQMALLMECCVNPSYSTEERMKAMKALRGIGQSLITLADRLHEEYSEDEEEDDEESNEVE